MRLEQKYFIPFLLIVFVVCIVVIAFFNLRTLSSQQLKLKESVDDGTELLDYSFPVFFSTDSLRIRDLDPDPVILVFWSSWSQRSEDALEAVLNFASDSDDHHQIIFAAVKDGDDFVRTAAQSWELQVQLVDGTKIYNDLRIPGLPALIYFDEDHRVIATRLGYRKAEDYAFLDMIKKGEHEYGTN